MGFYTRSVQLFGAMRLHATHATYSMSYNESSRCCVTDRLELLAQLLVEVRGLLQSGLQGGDLLLFNLQRRFQSRLQFGLQELEPDKYKYLN